MERQVDISFAHNGGSAVSFSSNAYGRFGRLAASKPKGQFHICPQTHLELFEIIIQKEYTCKKNET